MKNLFLLVAIFSISTFAKTQGNLQFNQVKLVSSLETVPSGKVWKVESCAYQGGTPICIAPYSLSPCNNVNGSNPIYALQSININSNQIYINTLSNNASSLGSSIQFPIWLPAGTTAAAGTNTRFLNVIEFNIVP
jgi:hypothetical protein